MSFANINSLNILHTVHAVEPSVEASRVDVIDDVGGGSMPQSALVLNGGCNSLVLFLHFALLEDVTAVDVRVLNARNLSREILTRSASYFSVFIFSHLTNGN